MKTPAPNCSVSGFHVPLKMKLKPECRNAGAACQTRLTTSDTTTAAKIRTPPHRSDGVDPALRALRSRAISDPMWRGRPGAGDAAARAVFFWFPAPRSRLS